MFVDRVKLQLHAGKGGNGIVAWRREKYIPKGGPSGGDGGNGGSVIFVCDAQLNSLDWYQNRTIQKAENGHQGGQNCRTGRKGKDLLIKVPCGTLITNSQTEEILCDLVKDGEQWVACQGGVGGKGNDRFKTPTNRAPNKATDGKPGEELEVQLELKLIADVGLVGFPNAGKSTLIEKLSNVRVKKAAYPFTTLHPNLGQMRLENFDTVVIADIPGIIEGAHRNKGLGFEFLRHIERTRLLLFVLDASGIDGRDPLQDLKILQEEIRAYNPEMLLRPSLFVLNKLDTEESKEHVDYFLDHAPIDRERLLMISAETGEGVPELKKLIASDTVLNVKQTKT